jgi:hypothetical protein
LVQDTGFEGFKVNDNVGKFGHGLSMLSRGATPRKAPASAGFFPALEVFLFVKGHLSLVTRHLSSGGRLCAAV